MIIFICSALYYQKALFINVIDSLNGPHIWILLYMFEVRTSLYLAGKS